MGTSHPDGSRAFRLTIAAVVCVAMAGTGFVAHSQYQESQRIAAEQAAERIEAAVLAGQSDQEFLAGAGDRVRQEQAAEFFEAIQQQRKDTVEHVRSHDELAGDTEGKVEDDDLHGELVAQIEALAEEASRVSTARLEGIVSQIDELAGQVQESHEEWEAEQERLRIEEEKRRERERQEAERQERERQEAARQAEQEQAAQQQQSSSSSSSGGSGSSGGGSGGAGSSSASSSSSSGSSPAPTQNSLRTRAEAIVAQHGCGSVPVVWDSSRLPAGANGAADWFQGNILLRSSMPEWRMPYVAAHECAHFLQWWAYDGNLGALESDMNAIYGGSGYSGLEQNADCITQRWGYSAWNYTQNCSGQRGQAAAAIVSGDRP